jgi:hypothetical protein
MHAGDAEAPMIDAYQIQHENPGCSALQWVNEDVV